MTIIDLKATGGAAKTAGDRVMPVYLLVMNFFLVS
jgi:hypothetical protein